MYRMTPKAVTEAAWFKSSYSSENGTACVEVAHLSSAGKVGIRDSKNPAHPALGVSTSAFAVFIEQLTN
jgi:hypothetical protein